MTLQELRNVIDIDVDGSLARFANMEAMYLKYLKRFNTEPTLDSLDAAVAAGDFGALETTAHTLKGICGNLGLNTLFNGYNDIVKAVREQRNDDALKLVEAIKAEVSKTRDAIAQLD